MRKILLAVLFLITGAAFGQTATQGAGAQSTSIAGASNQGNSQSITFTSPANTTQAITTTGTQTINTTGTQTINSNQAVSGTETIKNVPNPGAPALTTSNDTCMGSTSGSITIAGLGLGAGTTWTDSNCKRLKNSRELWNMGMRAAALALLCNDAENKTALEDTGYTCPAHKQTAAAEKQ